MTPEKKARAIVMNYRGEMSGHGAGELEIEIAKALREARSEGMAQAKDALLLADRYFKAKDGVYACDVWGCEKSAKHAVDKACAALSGEACSHPKAWETAAGAKHCPDCRKFVSEEDSNADKG